VAVDPDVGPVSGKRGDVYIADGYGNHRVVVFNQQLVSADNPLGYVGQFGTTCGHTKRPTVPPFPARLASQELSGKVAAPIRTASCSATTAWFTCAIVPTVASRSSRKPVLSTG
jgi:hypothetical protein